MLRIGEFARLARVSIKLLRHYDDAGLLPPHSVDRDTGYRYYSVNQLAALNRLLIYRRLGFSLKELRRLARMDASAGELLQMLTTLRTDLTTRVEAERARLAEVDARIALIERVGTVPHHEVAIRSMESAFAIGLRRRCRSYDEVGNLLQSIRSHLPARAPIDGYGAIWHRCAKDNAEIDCEALVFVDPKRRPAPSRATLIELPACTVASVFHEDSENDAKLAYRAAIERATTLGYRIAGPMREHYPGPQSASAALIEAQFPLELIARPA